ncbi:zinc-binding dehydrogenase [Streptomyces akebiae]|uniref:Zinc-binding dehydrogenase n=1 Tax=Streptomyces akebiae TaxID=2865673 RepID=A0ABX8XLY8_9ACTN|nr:zinc-binding dehydrogenase [Streptomyces akebiae]QYX76649.1 zinc-binding dehydrogenase [Streptomyces akebiae]
MRTIWLTEFGDPSVLVAGEAPDPKPGQGQVLVDVEAVNVVFIETQIRAGRPPLPMQSPTPPYVPGTGIGGVITAVGPHTDPGLLGRRVIGHTNGTGGYAEKAVVAAHQTIPIPAELSTADAVALLTDGSAALAISGLGAPKPDEWVLVEAAAGGLGGLLVQLALTAGAKVIGAVGSEAKLQAVRDAGAQAVTYARPDWTERVRTLTGGVGVDVVFDCVGGETGTAAASLVDAGGRFVLTGAAGGVFTDTRALAARGVTVIGLRQLMGALGNQRELAATALEEAVAGRLRPVIGRTFPLERAADAHAAMESRSTIGKTLLLV